MIPATFTPETELLSRMRAGDGEAFAAFVRKHTGRMLSLARGFLRCEEDAADVVQEAFLSAFKSLNRFEGQSSLATWLHRIVVNASLMKLRSKLRHRAWSIEELLPTFDGSGHHAQPVAAWSDTAFERMASDETREEVHACISQLPEDYRTVLVLRDIEELDTDQTAAVLGITPGAVKTRLHRARQALRTLLTPYVTENDAVRAP